MPRTKCVLSEAIAASKKVIVILNKIDRPGSRIDEVVEEIMGLFLFASDKEAINDYSCKISEK